MVRKAHRCSWFATALAAATLVGCHSGPFAPKERSTVITPAMRISAIQETATKADGSQSQQQISLTDQLASQIRTEPDPVVRRAIQSAVAEFRTPMAREILLAGLADNDPGVRVTCCMRLGERGETGAVASLRRVLETDEDLDVRIAAVDAMGMINSPEVIPALGVALADRDPAMQFAGIEALRKSTGEEFNGEVSQWQQYVASHSPASADAPQLAERPDGQATR